MENIDFGWVALLALLPLFFALGWFSARIDMRTVLKQAKSIPNGLLNTLNALIDNKTNIATRTLSDIVETEKSDITSYELGLSLGKLYRQRGENDKAINLHQRLIKSPDLTGNRLHQVQFELGQDFQNAGLVDRAEREFESLLDTEMANQAHEILLQIYQQDRNWQKAIETAGKLSHDATTYQFEIAQFYCELAQANLFKSNYDEARNYIQAALNANKKCTRASLLLGDLEYKLENFQAACDAYTSIEHQNYNYLVMASGKLYDAYEALGNPQKALEILLGYARTFPQLDFLNIIYEKSLVLYGEDEACQTAIKLVRNTPSLAGVHRLLGLNSNEVNPLWKPDIEMMRNVIGKYIQKSFMYRCQNCHFKSQVFFWHCPACNRWETFTPHRIEV